MDHAGDDGADIPWTAGDRTVPKRAVDLAIAKIETRRQSLPLRTVSTASDPSGSGRSNSASGFVR
jgi:hypothetical protein